MHTEADIEKIVELVTKRVLEACADSASAKPEIVDHSNVNNVIDLRGFSVISSELLSRNGVRKGTSVMIANSAILTPSARDDVKHLSIQLKVSGLSKANPGKALGESKIRKSWVVISESATPEKVDAKLIQRKGIQQLVTESIAQMRIGNHVLALSERPFLAAALMNRKPEAFVAVVSKPKCVERLRREHPFNGFVLDAGKVTEWQDWQKVFQYSPFEGVR